MKTRLTTSLITIAFLFAFSCLLPNCLSANYNCSYQLLEHPDSSTNYRLNVAVSQSLQDYYAEKSHRMNSNADFAKFVTPYALKPIADCLNQIYTDDEDFTNGVLMIVHQIPYEVTVPSKCPVETIVDNKGDCDLFSYIAASILKAHGLDVVLLYYETEAHMNIGVSLSQVPNDARGDAFCMTKDGAKYYMAECTGENWQAGWRVGECPDKLKAASAQIVTLENCEQTAPGQVSASYRSLASSVMFLTVSPSFSIEGSVLTLSGQLSPALSDETVTIYIKTSNSPWTSLATVITDSSGRFTYSWIPDSVGIDYIRASWSGDDNYASVDSSTHSVTILSTFFVALIGITVALVTIGLVIFLVSRREQQEILVPLPPEIPS